MKPVESTEEARSEPGGNRGHVDGPRSQIAHRQPAQIEQHAGK
jgi:hypothetical protein